MKGRKALFPWVDASDPEAAEKMVADIVEAFGSLDIDVNNARINGASAQTGEYDIENWHRVIGVNLNGVFYGMRYEIPKMLSRGGGTVVKIASILGAVGFATAPAYVAAKQGVVVLTKTAALEYGQQGIRINSVGPGFIQTPLVDDVFGEETRERLAGLHAVGR
jgi:NAD(P)-dependent dehydrogenase (short-subunit alcohol dehydrogenase family)